MRLFKTRRFRRWAAKEGLTDAVLRDAAVELQLGLADPLGGYVYKQRVALPGRGKRGGARTRVVYRAGQAIFFVYGFPKSQRANIDRNELKALQLIAKELLGYSDQALAQAIATGELFEVGASAET